MALENSSPLQLFGDWGFVGGEDIAPDRLQNAQVCINFYPEVDKQNPKEVLALLGCPGLVPLVAAPSCTTPSIVQTVYSAFAPVPSGGKVVTVSGVGAGNTLVVVTTGMDQDLSNREPAGGTNDAQGTYTTAVHNGAAGLGGTRIEYLRNANAGTHSIHVDPSGFTGGDIALVWIYEISGDPGLALTTASWHATVPGGGGAINGSITAPSCSLIIAGIWDNQGLVGQPHPTPQSPWTEDVNPNTGANVSGFFLYGGAGHLASSGTVTIAFSEGAPGGQTEYGAAIAIQGS